MAPAGPWSRKVLKSSKGAHVSGMSTLATEGMPQAVASRHPAELPGRAKAPQVARHDGTHRGRIDAEALEGAPLVRRRGGHDIVAHQQPDLIGGQERLRQELQDARLQLREP